MCIRDRFTNSRWKQDLDLFPATCENLPRHNSPPPLVSVYSKFYQIHHSRANMKQPRKCHFLWRERKGCCLHCLQGPESTLSYALKLECLRNMSHPFVWLEAQRPIFRILCSIFICYLRPCLLWHRVVPLSNRGDQEEVIIPTS